MSSDTVTRAATDPVAAQATSRRTATPNGVLAIVCVGICLANLDLFIVNVALPSIAKDFNGATLEDLSWVLNGYAVAYAALLVFFGRLSERYRRDLQLPCRRHAIHGRVGGLRFRAKRLCAGSLSHCAGCRRGAHDTDVAWPPTGFVSARTTRHGRARLDRDRRLRGGARPTCRWCSRCGELALDFSRQRADRDRRRSDRLVETA